MRGEENRRRKGRKPKEQKTVVTDEIQTVEVEPGKFVAVVANNGLQIQTPIPKGMSPVEYLTIQAGGMIQRVEAIAMSGTAQDSVRLKANLALLNKVVPDVTRNEIEVKRSPYERFLEMLEGAERKG